MHDLLTLGSVVLAIVNVGVMWAMAHQWRYAWHSNLALQLLWLPYDYLTSQYGLLGLGVIITFVSLKGAFRENQLANAAEHNQPSHRRPHRRGRTRARASSGLASGTPAAEDTTDLPAAGASAGAEGQAAEVLHAGATAPKHAADLADGGNLAGASVSAGATATTTAADCEGDELEQPPAAPRIPQQADRRTAFDNQRHPHFH
jgi:hypothetical protein